MIISDYIYGEFEIDDVLEELILSKPMQRLKGIHQGGASYLVNSQWNVTRFEHSVGVMLLIKQVGGSLEEQIAGLLHDVSHTAFSHVIDFVLENKAEDYHEEIFMDVIRKSEIPIILKKYNYNYEHLLLNTATWNLLEQPAPELCADRVDYTLRDMYVYGQASREEIQKFLNDIIVYQGKMCLQSIELAEWFVKTYYQEVLDFFMDPLNIYAYYKLAQTLKLSLEKKIITFADFLKEDHELIERIKSSNDRQVQSLFKQLHSDVKVRVDQKEFDIHQKNKTRLIDPLLYFHNRLLRASELSEDVRKMNVAANEKFQQGVFVKIL
ncbi:HD domain-containing protein [Lysinibacillus xylanilyticus]|uniref:HD domain-containing protein n=1 Tax=Lysinibacillus xylanilyticus TaxID=582475 RepID=UPI002B24491A|nr:HD domain-containing protein [Lysinibacillus xylanilyticus]MEB2301506.1 HD domain-containing protein [Lysinibacillus xylanilyticus]